MEALFKLQYNQKNVIERGIVNYKKSPKERITEPYVRTRLEQLELNWTGFMSTHKSIIQSMTSAHESSNYFTENIYELTEEMYINHKCDLRIILDRKKAGSTTSSEIVASAPSAPNIRLPKICIEKFSGTYEEWPTFKDMFCSLIHNNATLDDVQRMHYLKSLLCGEAEHLVRHIPITSSNYAECWSLLVSRYENKRFLANRLLNRLINQRTITECSDSVKGLLDTTMECLNGLKNIGVDVSTWDTIVIHIVSAKLDPESRMQWETSISAKDDLPTLPKFEEFLESRFRALEYLNTKSNKPTGKPIVTPRQIKSRVHHVTDEQPCQPSSLKCPFCEESHKLAYCKLFAKECYDSRHNFVKKEGLCFNCFGRHSLRNCRHTTTCKLCKRRHHSLLHPKTADTNTVEQSSSSSSCDQVTTPDKSNFHHVTSHVSKESDSEGLLGTAVVGAKTLQGINQLLRLLLDQGSQSSFITEAAVQLLGLKKRPKRTVFSGVGDQDPLCSNFTVSVTLHSRTDTNFSLTIEAHVVKNITSLLPSGRVKIANWPEIEALTLADPQYHTPNKIDMLLGAKPYGKVLKEGLIKGPAPESPIAQDTHFGWVLSGEVPSASATRTCHHITMSSTNEANDDLLKKFWEIESVIPEVQEKAILTEEEVRCEEIYQKTTCRDEEGRYVVKLPFRDEDPQCQYGNSRDLALKRFHHLEGKFKKNRELAERYKEVFNEYIELGHMERVPKNDEKRSTAVYLPHHAVVRENKATSKVRIVFDASMKSLNSPSLNEDLLVGPMLQQPLRHIIMRWRQHPISISADIVKMYRQVKIAPEDADFQRVVWREDPESETEEYKLVRVTFGTASAPYLAVKTLQQIAVDEGAGCPDVAEKIKDDFFVDDLMTGCKTVEEGVRIHKEMTELLNKGGFQLQKWTSSSKELNKEFKGDRKDRKGIGKKEEESKSINEDEVMKILGISWNRERDEFQYSVNILPEQSPVTKRRVISDISRFYDPLGWAAPCVVTSKIFIQKLWLSGLEWDEELTPELLTEWHTYRSNLTETSNFSVPRWIHTNGDEDHVELHGFSDASLSAYAAVVYLRTKNKIGEINVSLITAKTRVAPVKQQSIPRLELMGSVLAAELTAEVTRVLKIPNNNIHLWTDSSVVLAWLSSHPSRWKTFVGNRVSTILSLYDNTHWAHVQSSFNPADIASRGLTPKELSSNELWAHGPSWLKEDTINYSRPAAITTNLEERTIKVHHTTESEQEDSVWTKYSTLSKLVRVIAYCLRVKQWRGLYGNARQYKGCLKVEEIEEALRVCIKHAQAKEFGKEIKDIQRNGQVSATSRLRSLCPVIDDDGLLRGSGRIDRADLATDTKRPIILPHNNHLTDLIIDEAHRKTLHGGPSLMLSHLRTRYWIISAKSLVRAHVRKCVKCKRYASNSPTQLMGQLPECRIKPSRPFKNSGVDFAGPINLRTSKGRGHKSYKGYICVWVCMVTKAIHLDAISDLTSAGFIAGFKRFVSRRGHVSNVWSDNGTNFVGAAKELRHLVEAEKSSVASEIKEWLGNNGTTWHFNPPHAPNFNGLMEAGVKSTKFHLRRIIGDSTLTYEELATVLAQIEACLNSRPLSIMPGNPDEPTPLTPGHFLVGEPLVSVPDHNYEGENISSLRRWQLTQRMVQQFWRRWSDEYLTHLLQRHKWNRDLPQPKIGDVVLVKEDGLPPARWLLGKIIATHPGADNVTRVVTLKCNNTLMKRPLSKLCILPVHQ